MAECTCRDNYLLSKVLAGTMGPQEEPKEKKSNQMEGERGKYDKGNRHEGNKKDMMM